MRRNVTRTNGTWLHFSASRRLVASSVDGTLVCVLVGVQLDFLVRFVCVANQPNLDLWRTSWVIWIRWSNVEVVHNVNNEVNGQLVLLVAQMVWTVKDNDQIHLATDSYKKTSVQWRVWTQVPPALFEKSNTSENPLNQANFLLGLQINTWELYLHVVSLGLRINREFGTSLFGLNGVHLYRAKHRYNRSTRRYHEPNVDQA